RVTVSAAPVMIHHVPSSRPAAPLNSVTAGPMTAICHGHHSWVFQAYSAPPTICRNGRIGPFTIAFGPRTMSLAAHCSTQPPAESTTQAPRAGIESRRNTRRIANWRRIRARLATAGRAVKRGWRRHIASHLAWGRRNEHFFNAENAEDEEARGGDGGEMAASALWAEILRVP